MKVAVGADHRGFGIKKAVVRLLRELGHDAVDVGTRNAEPCDYPDYAFKAACLVAEGKADRGILVCKSGIGMAIAANKVRGIRAALCASKRAAALSRRHNDANVLVVGADELTDPVRNVVKTWLDSPFEGGRHLRRLKKILKFERTQKGR